MNSDRIEKSIVLRAPRSRVWRALADSQAFGEWFGMKFNGSFSPGARVKGQVLHKGYEHLTVELSIERIEPEHLFSWRWHPHSVDTNLDYSQEPTTLVVFELADAADGTLLRVVESGFDGIPLTRRMEAYRGNEQGWGQQMEAIERYVGQAAQSA